ncbi:MAG: HRDC domain-containing protein, partial [Alphaproteobacteria bacterium]|nr:HRDC domain-containing protein [Alphaproteobacteria bacterium]
LTGKTPSPAFDTQIAAMALGQGEQIGYANLVESWLGIHLDKGARFTDWAKRPLDKRQIDYAIGDVTHLAVVFPKMLKRLIKTGRGDWLNEEMERLVDPAGYAQNPDDAWQRVKCSSRKRDVLGRLKALAAWREVEAQNRNIPRGRMMKDEVLAEIAAHPPKTQADLPQMRGVSTSWGSNDIGARLMAVLERAVPLPNEDMPEKKASHPNLGRDGALVVDLLKLLLKIRAKELDIATRLLARSDDLEALAAGQRKGLGILEGWRFEHFGKDAVALVEGQMAFAVRNGKMQMSRVEG